MSKVDVNGAGADPLFQFLKEKKGGLTGDDVSTSDIYKVIRMSPLADKKRTSSSLHLVVALCLHATRLQQGVRRVNDAFVCDYYIQFSVEAGEEEWRLRH